MMIESSDYRIIRTLKEGITTLVFDPAGRKRVLKLLPSDCLWRGKLHPNVSDRLERLREIPGTSFQGLIGVEVQEMGVMSVTPYIEGNNLRECSDEQRAEALKQLPRIVSSLHRLGMVHGAIGPGNIIVDREENAHLIDASPLLHDDFDVELQAIQKLGCTIVPGETSELSPVAVDHSIRYRSILAAGLLVIAAIGVAWWVRAIIGM